MSSRLGGYGSVTRLVAVMSTLAAAAPAFGQIARLELHPFTSTTPTDHDFLGGKRDAKAVTLAAELRLPKPGPGRLPAVILIHGSGGPSGAIDAWARTINGLGIATFIVDSFTGRGLTTVGDDQSQLGRLVMIVDAYRALDRLALHPRIDPARIAVMGFSRGGQAALYASLDRFWRLQGTPERARFAAYLAFYPACNTTFVGDDNIAAQPIRLFHGSADDYVPVAPCRTYVERLRKRGRDVVLTEYPGAHHVFDRPSSEPPRKLPRAQTTRNCVLVESPEGRIINGKTKQPFTYDDPCVERGPTLGYHAEAHARAEAAVKDFLHKTLKP